MSGSEKYWDGCLQSPADGTDRQPERKHRKKKHPCEGCYYRGGKQQSVQCCNYFLMTGKRRPCEPGEGCIVRDDRRAKKNKPMKVRKNSVE